MFQGSFCESKDQTATLEAVDGVISEQSFEGLLQWLFLGRVTFGHTDPGQLITAFIELARLADMCGIIEPRDYLARRVKEVIAMNDEGTTFSLTRDITSEHISSAGELPEGHPLFRVLCMASVREVLAAQTCKLANESSLCLGYAAGVLEEVMITLKTLRVSSRTQALKPGTKGHVKTSLSCYVDDPINLEKPLIMPGKSLKKSQR